jgi:hypothetical protein
MNITDNCFIWCIVHPTDTFKKILRENPNIDSIILYSLEESLNWTHLFSTQLEEKLSLVSDKEIHLMVNDTCPFSEYGGYPLIKNPAFLLKSVYRTIHDSNQLSNNKWNSNSSKALILTGKAHNPNRIGLLVELVKDGSLKNHIYSFFPPLEKNYKNQTLETFSKVCDWDYDEFCSKYKNNPDNIDIRNNEDDMHYSGFPFDVKLFEDTLISVISETNCESNGNRPDFSEKTYKAIINKHPFLMLNQGNSLPLLKEYGFHTFEDYMEFPEYDLIEDPFEKNRVVIRNLNYFLENYKKFETEINEKIEHNYNLMISIYNNFKKNNPKTHKGLEFDFFMR